MITESPGCLSMPPPFFFFQAEDGIRDLTVTGVQTCALPISSQIRLFRAARYELPRRVHRPPAIVPRNVAPGGSYLTLSIPGLHRDHQPARAKIGRAHV